MYEESLDLGVDTFICGDFKEPVPAISLESETNFVALGHYVSEKPGILALMEHLVENFSIEAWFIDINNPF